MVSLAIASLGRLWGVRGVPMGLMRGVHGAFLEPTASVAQAPRTRHVPWDASDATNAMDALDATDAIATKSRRCRRMHAPQTPHRRRADARKTVH